MIVDHNQETRKRKFPHENFLQSPNIHPDLIGHITKKVKLNMELLPPDKNLKSMNSLMKMLTLEDQSKYSQNQSIYGIIPFQMQRPEASISTRPFQKIKGYSIIKNQKEKENGEIDFDSLLCDASNLKLDNIEPVWNVFQYFKSELKVLGGKDFEGLFEGLKEKISEYLKTIHIEDINSFETKDKSSQEVQDIFVMIFKRIIFGFEDLWNFLAAFLRLEYTLPFPELSSEKNKYTNKFTSMEEIIVDEGPRDAFAVTLTKENVEDLPIFLIKVRTDEEYELENEKDAMYSQMRSIAQRINARELYGLLAADRRVRFVKYEIVQGQGERMLISASIPFIPEELLEGTAMLTCIDDPLKVIICMLVESVKNIILRYPDFIVYLCEGMSLSVA